MYVCVGVCECACVLVSVCVYVFCGCGVCSSHRSARLVVKRGIDVPPMLWREFLQHHQLVDIRLTIGRSRTTTKPLSVGVFRRHEGCSLWWCMADFYSVCNLTEKDFASRSDPFLGYIGLTFAHFLRHTHTQTLRHRVA